MASPFTHSKSQTFYKTMRPTVSWLPLILFHHCPHSLCSCHAGLSAHQQTCQARCLLGSLAPAASCAWTLFLWISTGDTLSPLSEISSNVTVSTSSGRRDKVLHVGGWPKRTETCFLTDLEPNSPKSSCQKGVLPLTTLREHPFLPLLSS